MKTFCLALIASVAMAGDALPDQAVATDFAWTENIAGPGSVSGSVTAMTDADGVCSFSVSANGSWGADIKEKSKTVNGYVGVGFESTADVEGTDDDGNTVTESVSTQEWAISSGASAGKATMDVSGSTYTGIDLGGSQGGVWSWTAASGTLNGKVFTGQTWTATRAFDTAGPQTFTNGWTGNVWGAAWIDGGDATTGSMAYTVSLEVPAPVDDGTTDGGDGTTDGDMDGDMDMGSAALMTSAACAIALATLF